MKLKQIDKVRYRKHLNIVIVACVVALAMLSLGISQSIIFLFTDREGTHFWLNVLGVVVAMLIIGKILTSYKQHPFMTEVSYVWDLKQAINKIHRKHRSIEAARAQDNVEAVIILFFYYKACHQLYTLDDNTITMSELTVKRNALDTQIEELSLSVNVEDFNFSLLEQFKYG